MSRIAYVCDSSRLGEATISGKYDIVSIRALEEKNSTFSIIQDGKKYAYHIHKNKPLTELYGFQVCMVDFIFSDIETLHEEGQFQVIKKLLHNLKENISKSNRYYILRVPTHIVDLIKLFNLYFKNAEFCGGLVTYISQKKEKVLNLKTQCHILHAKEDYLLKHKEILVDIARKAFEEYQGQYHISNTLDCKASQIYSKWLRDAFFNTKQGTELLVAEYNNEPVAFWIYEEDAICGKAVLAGVSDKYRGIGAYTGLISEAWNIAMGHDKYFTAGTQFDNFVVQGVWTKLGMKPYMSYYTFHLDCR